MADHAFPLKTIGDALSLRSHVMDQLEWAEVCDDPARRQWYLSFVVVGGGYSGVEVAGEINDLVRASLKLFRHLKHESVRVTLVHSRAQILPEIGEELREFARNKMERAGVRFQLQSRVALATREGVELADGTFIAAGTVVSTVGTQPSTLVERLDVAKTGERLATRPDLRLVEHDDVWAIGDCAHIVNALDGAVCPPTAQFADRQGRVCAANVVATIDQREMQAFRYQPQGQLCSIGGHRAVAELLGFRVGGFFAWLTWRAIYLMKVPAWSRRTQIVFDWLWVLVFPRDLSHLKPRVTDRVSRAHYRSGDIVMRAGEAPHAFYAIERGEVEVLQRREDALKEEVVAVLGPGAFFGERALIDDRPRAASVRARNSLELLVIGREVFTQMSRSLAPLRDVFANSIARRSRDPWEGRADVIDALKRLTVHDVLESFPEPLLAPTLTVRDATRTFARTTTDVLYVSRDGRTLDGLVTLEGLLRAKADGAVPSTPIETLMIVRPLALTLQDSCTTVFATMQEHVLTSVPIVHDGGSRELAGCITLRRLVAKAFDAMDVAVGHPAPECN